MKPAVHHAVSPICFSALKLDFYRNSPLIGMDAVTVGCPVFSYDQKCIGAAIFFLKPDDIQKEIVNTKTMAPGEFYYSVSC